MFPLNIANKCKIEIKHQGKIAEPIIGANYTAVKTKHQIKSLLVTGDRMFKMLTKFFGKYDWGKYLNTEIKKGHDDQKILTDLRRYSIKEFSKSDRANQRALSLAKLVLDSEKAKVSTDRTAYKYLDLGSTDGEISNAIGKYLGLNKSQIIAADVPGWEDVNSKQKNQNVTNVVINQTGALPFGDKSFDFITVFMVLHHIEDVNARIAEIYRILKPGGVLTIREHDCDNDYTRMLCDLEHSIYDVAILKPPNKTFFDTYNAWYRSREQWNLGLQSFGFKLIKDDGKTWNTATRGYHEVYSK